MFAFLLLVLIDSHDFVSLHCKWMVGMTTTRLLTSQCDSPLGVPHHVSDPYYRLFSSCGLTGFQRTATNQGCAGKAYAPPLTFDLDAFSVETIDVCVGLPEFARLV